MHGPKEQEPPGQWEDPILSQIRRIREEHAARFNYDLWAIYEDLKEQERKSGRKFVSYPPRRIPPAERTAGPEEAERVDAEQEPPAIPQPEGQ